MTDPIDIKSKRKLSDIEAEEREWEQQGEEEFRAGIQLLLDQYQDLLDNGKLTSVSFTGTSEGGVVSPRAIYRSMDDLHKLQFAVQESSLGLHEYIADCYDLRDMEYLEE